MNYARHHAPDVLPAAGLPLANVQAASFIPPNDHAALLRCQRAVDDGCVAIEDTKPVPAVAAHAEKVGAGGMFYEEFVEAERRATALGRRIRKSFVRGNGRAGLEGSIFEHV